VRLHPKLPGFIERSLRLKVTALVLAITVLALGLSAAGLVLYDLRAHERQVSTDLLGQAEVLGRAAAPAMAFNDPRAAEKDLSVMQVRPRVQAAALYTREGKLFASYSRPGQGVHVFPSSPGTEGYAIEGGHMVLFRAVVENNERIGTVYLNGLYDPWDHLADYLAILLLVMLASLAVAAFLSGWLQTAVTVPILEVARVSKEVMQNRDYSLRVAKTTSDEVGELVDAFNAMLAEIGRRSEALRAADQRKDEFLATLAHELRNPLAPVRNALEILRLAGDDPAKAAKAREMMQRQVAQLVRLVDDLIDVSRITTGKLAVRKVVFDLRSALRDAVETARPFIDSRRHALDVRLPRETLPVDGDATRLAQVFSNLLNNAAKYTEPGGRIELAARRDGKEIEITVRDDGIGIAPESMESIFDMFVQVDRSLERTQAGLGVGLTLSRRLVELHQGTIQVASEGKGRGSVFTVRLPASYTRLEDASGPADRAGAGGPVRRVLLADDNVDFVNSLGQLLESSGHEVRIAYDGAEAIEKAREFHPEIAFIDIGMPKVHGYDVARRLRSQPDTADCMLVAVTGWGQEGDRARAREAGFDRHLVKPVDPAEIEAIVNASAIDRV
jgi:signal transduction histidine kinase/ActR/RegA family two-component response regulator